MASPSTYHRIQEKTKGCYCLTKKNTPHLNKPQFDILHTLKENNDLIILPTDKILGPAIINRTDYITQILKEHLTNDYAPFKLQKPSTKSHQ